MTMARDKGDGQATREIRLGGRSGGQPEARESQAGSGRKSERSIVPVKPGNAGGGKGPHFQTSIRRSENQEIDVESRNSGIG